jgi:hypothetical protein
MRGALLILVESLRELGRSFLSDLSPRGFRAEGRPSRFLPSLDLGLDFEPLNRDPPKEAFLAGRPERGLLASSAISCAPIRIQTSVQSLRKHL